MHDKKRTKRVKQLTHERLKSFNKSFRKTTREMIILFIEIFIFFGAVYAIFQAITNHLPSLQEMVAYLS